MSASEISPKLRGLLKAAMEANYGEFEPQRLDPALACLFLKHELVLCVMDERTDHAPRLLANAEYAHLFEVIAGEIKAAAPATLDASQIEPMAGNTTAETIAKMLKDGTARVDGRDILLDFPGPSKASMRIGRVVQPNGPW